MARNTSKAKPKSHELATAQTPGLNKAAVTIAEGAVLTAQLDANIRAVAQQIGYQLPADCTDRFLMAFWNRAEEVLDRRRHGLWPAAAAGRRRAAA